MYLVIVDTTIDNKIAKKQEYTTRAEADAHVARVIGDYPDTFVIDNPIDFDEDHTTVDVAAKTITYDATAYSDKRIMEAWKRDMQDTDGGMPRFLEDLITSNASLVIPAVMKERYDNKVALRSTKP